VKSEVPSDAQALIHTHEPGVSPQPSRQDIEVAKQLGCPNYELSMFALWVANPDGTTAKVGDVEMKHGELVIK
jgi:proteasome lid subunit RPN8/RPN11